MLLEDGCRESIDDFSDRTDKCRALDFYPDEKGRNRCWMCGWFCEKNNDPRYVKAHVTRSKHNWNKQRAHETAKKDVLKDKLEKRQQDLSRVFWGKLPLNEVLRPAK